MAAAGHRTQSPPDLRTGIGYDLHRLVQGRPLRIGGVLLPSPVGPEGHSDGDCLLHALCDALLGAMGEDDIGTHFPDSDPAFAGASSDRFVRRALEIASERGFRLLNVDSIVLAERPKLGDSKKLIREALSKLLKLPADRIAVKAKSGEGVDAIGRGEAIAAFVSVLIMRETSG